MRCFLKSLEVREDERNKGYGTRLFRAASTYALENGIDKVEMLVTDESKGFWNGVGVKILDERDENGFAKAEFSPQGFDDEKIEGIIQKDVRIVCSETEPVGEDHLFAWYRDFDGASLAKLRLTFLKE